MAGVTHAEFSMSMELEDYNGWNLPFSKKMKIQPSDVFNGQVDIDTDMDFPTGEYQMEVDPTAYFSIIWIGEEYLDQVPSPDLIKTINYTFYGNSLYESKGVWAGANITVDGIHFEGNDTTIELDFNLIIFIGFSDPPESGLDGTIGLADSQLY